MKVRAGHWQTKAAIFAALICSTSLLVACEQGDADCDEGQACADSQKDKEIVCDETAYWHEASLSSPYPGMDCDSGPIKRVRLRFLVPQDEAGNAIASTETLAEALVVLQERYSVHGIDFDLAEPVAIPEVYTSDNYLTLFSDYAQAKDVNVILFPQPPTEEAGDGPWKSTAHYPWSSGTMVKVSVRNVTAKTLAHEMGHYLGLFHTYENATWTHSGAPDWDDSSLDFEGLDGSQGDFVASTAFDCLECEDAFGDPAPFSCDPFDLVYGKLIEHFYDECMDEIAEGELGPYAPPTLNLMSYYSQTRDVLNKEQGARMRYYLMHRLSNSIGDFALEEVL
ncbi:MAG: M43 family zinc metalloprotease [Myxococcota bacterium]|jgi:hypothetical protein|nr:M43 family zinc metalloprotease [Myxococcota bacterium]